MAELRSGQRDAYQLILDAIDIGIYRPGDRLVESELANAGYRISAADVEPYVY